MNNDIIFGDEARHELLKGIKKLDKAVGLTLGPGGRNVLYPMVTQNMRIPFSISTKDGFTVAARLALQEMIQEMGKNTVRQATSQTNMKAGDGTTTSTVIACALLMDLLPRLGDVGPLQKLFGKRRLNAQHVAEGIRFAAKNIEESIRDLAGPVSKENLYDVALISTNGDEVVAKAVAECFEKQWLSGRIDHVKSHIEGVEVFHQVGHYLDSRMIGPDWINVPSKGSCDMENVHILITDEGLHHDKKLIQAFGELVRKQATNVLIICDELNGSAMSMLVAAHRNPQNPLNLCVVNAPSNGRLRMELLEDLGIATGGRVMSKHTGYTIQKLNFSHVGHADRITVNEKGLFIQVSDHAENLAVINRIIELKELQEQSEDEQVRKHSKLRLEAMQGGLSEIRTGGFTDLEREERDHKVDDAIKACRCAIEEGMLNGGGITSYKISANCLSLGEHVTESFRAGYEAMYRAMARPLEKILENCNWTNKEVSSLKKDIAKRMVKSYEYLNPGLRPKTSFLEQGIIDPAKVLRVAVANAASVAAALVLTESVLFESDKSTNTHSS